MQLLVRNAFQNYDTWKSAFDGDAESRMTAGLTLLQVWRDSDVPRTVWYLLEVNDHDKAQAYMDGDHARLLGDRAGVTDGEYHFLETI
ncbi:hypothetical protein [Pseudoruegeria sp. HB172150]|uniref:hypothetical protein n=1 Tax=Pseudoruegeria sp. HB172150 TaxID=2721164 RepID=UPI001553A615|nr:hypothetical protein [Pseudoruegeria sp. HB172150]